MCWLSAHHNHPHFNLFALLCTLVFSLHPSLCCSHSCRFKHPSSFSFYSNCQCTSSHLEFRFRFLAPFLFHINVSLPLRISLIYTQLSILYTQLISRNFIQKRDLVYTFLHSSFCANPNFLLYYWLQASSSIY